MRRNIMKLFAPLSINTPPCHTKVPVQPRAAHQFESGVTLIELMVTLLVASILGLVAIPSYQSVIKSNRMASEANNLLGDVEFARSEAIKRGQTVLVCPTTTGTTCSGAAAWSTGWIVFVPSNGSCTSAGGGPTDIVLRKQSPFSSTDTATSSPNNFLSICFNRLGFSPATSTGLVKFNAVPSSAYYERCLALASVGHPQVLQNGQSDTSGALQCTYP